MCSSDLDQEGGALTRGRAGAVDQAQIAEETPHSAGSPGTIVRIRYTEVEAVM